jgi:hypothetical protein
MNDRPGWIRLLYKRHNAWQTLHTAFLWNHFRIFVAEEADAQPNGREHLREVALEELASQDFRLIAFSLLCLGIVGRREDLPLVERFVACPDDLTRRAALAAQFELKKRSEVTAIGDH